VVDRYERRLVASICQTANALAAALIAWLTLTDELGVGPLFLAAGLLGLTAAFEGPALAALLPQAAPAGFFARAAALDTGAFQLAIVSGPALGGLAYALSPATPWVLMTAACAAAAFLAGSLSSAKPLPVSRTRSELFAGIVFVRGDPTILGSLSLDLFAVLFGGATALLPIFARDILHTGPFGLGMLRAAPAVGALATTLYLAHRPIGGSVGRRLFQAVSVFGIGSVLFGLSQNLAWALASLALMGAADTFSMVIRISLVQLRTPPAMRGRVGAVNSLFVNASGQLGEFESGMVAALLGAVPSVVLGGLGTILIALLWMKLFPALRAVESLE
jgi:MFS family permease